MFRDRAEAGYLLGGRVAALGLRRPVVLAVPRGGVPVGAEVAARIGAPLGLVFVCKIGVPAQPELAAGAVALGPGDADLTVWNPDILRAARLSQTDLAPAARRGQADNSDRLRRWLNGAHGPTVAGAEVVVVDDGLATGATARAALQAVRAMGAVRVVLAVPVAETGACAALAPLADGLIVAETPQPFGSVGAHYRSFPEVTEAEVLAALNAAASPVLRGM